jgi:hypothetical protein
METSPQEIRNGLYKIRVIRFLSHFPFLMIFLFILSFMIFPLEWVKRVGPLFESFLYWSFLGVILWFVVRRLLCPRCGHKFHHRGSDYRKSVGIDSILGAFFEYNDFARKCTYCGLKLNGSNIKVLIDKPIKPQNLTNKYKSKVAINLSLTIFCLLFLLKFLGDYINAPVPKELKEVSGDVEEFSCHYQWLNYRGQVVRISLRNDDNIYEVKKDLRSCEQYNEQVKRNFKIVMLVDSNNSILEIISDGRSVFTYNDWRNYRKFYLIMFSILTLFCLIFFIHSMRKILK